MSLVLENTEADTRARILKTAERLFREIGYQKTTVADIAKILRMSPANVYRFFDSKKSIHEGVARLLMGEVEAAVHAIAEGPASPPDKLYMLLATIHRMNSERYVGDEKLHEMVRIAMDEDWAVCNAHIEHLTVVVAGVIAEGMERGDFKRGDVETVAMCVCSGMARFFHPQMIAECANKPGPTLEQMIDFLIAAISVDKGGQRS
ncbi:MAG: TetR family transcriptional regulator [Proteobacteria bacterium SG_bin9]|nr:MAG: TetR family transcriptional regulator [Proteobacteria bacterium SG_bin9]